MKLRVRQKASTIGTVEHTRRIIKGLGLRGPGSEVVVANTPSFRGMVKKVLHLVEVEEVAGDTPSPKS
jgi:large subunit ribosomal protein L30